MTTETTQPLKFRTVDWLLPAVIALSLVLAFALPGYRVAIGIAFRLIMAVILLGYTVWIFRMGKPVVAGLVLLVAVGLAATALMGYSFNGTPPVPWLGQ